MTLRRLVASQGRPSSGNRLAQGGLEAMRAPSLPEDLTDDDVQQAWTELSGTGDRRSDVEHRLKPLWSQVGSLLSGVVVVCLALVSVAAVPSSAEARPSRSAGKPEILKHVPRLRRYSPEASHDLWTRIKQSKSAPAQIKSVERTRALSRVCDGLVDMRELVNAGKTSFGFRDQVRHRTWARPSLARVLVDAKRIYEKRFPQKSISIGDVAQVGCGQLSHGALVAHIEGEQAQRVVNDARLIDGVPTAVRYRLTDGETDAHRFEVPGQRVRVETRVLGYSQPRKGPLRLRVESTRYLETPATADEVDAMKAKLKKISTKRNRVSKRRVRHFDHRKQKRVRAWRYHWVDTRRRRQLVLITDKPIGRRLSFRSVIDARLSSYQDRKPGSFPNQTMWRPGANGQWLRWAQVYEAGHVSHHSGRDADLSYITKENTRHFAVDYEALDVAATWAWFESLEAAAKGAGVELELILVDPRIKRHLKKHLPKAATKTPLFRNVLRLSRGHDGHHHIRVVADASRERRARRALKKLAVR